MADEMTPEEEAAAREGFLGNPVAVAYAKAHAEGAVPLQPGGEVEVNGTRLACWWADRLGTFRVQDAAGEWQPVDLGAAPDAHRPTIEWHPIPGTGLEIREVEDVPRFRWHVRPIGVDPS
ncbi:hypothetical protein K1W54_04690 [Micromonospora sp. CPCC 205371]|nr:hypothetical protein [Micromonospora sp. CPCC 205371]